MRSEKHIHPPPSYFIAKRLHPTMSDFIPKGLHPPRGFHSHLPHSSLRFSLPPGGRWQSKTDGRSLRQYFLPPVNGYEAQATRALLHRKVRSITRPSPLGKVDCEARRMRLRCANNPLATLPQRPVNTELGRRMNRRTGACSRCGLILNEICFADEVALR